jgi:hypothetical protein
MATPQIPKAPPPLARSQKPPSSPLGQSVDPTLPLPKVQAEPAPKPPVKLRIKLHYGYPIHIPHLNRLLRPDETVELDDHEWLRKQISAGTFDSIEV